MSGQTLSFQIATGAMRLLRDQHSSVIFQSLGITPEDFELLTGKTIWVAGDRHRVRSCLDAACAGVMDVVGVPRFEMPAEYIAAVIACFVAPANVLTACRWMERQRAGDELRGATSGSELVDPSQVFALVLLIYDDKETGEIRQAFEKLVNGAIKRSTEKAA